MEETAENRQRAEFQVIKSIYGDQIRDQRSKVKAKKWKPLNFIIQLNPQRGNDSLDGKEAYVDLHIKCPEEYPDQSPELKIDKVKGLSNMLVNQLSSELKTMAANLIGNEVIFDLCQHVQQFLYNHYQPSTKSFYEEMIISKEFEKVKIEEAKKLEDDKKAKDLQEEINKILSQQATPRRRKSSDILKEGSNSSESRKEHTPTETSKHLACSHEVGKILTFSKNKKQEIYMGSCLDHPTKNCTLLIGIDQNSGEHVIVTEWVINDSSLISRELSNIEQEFTTNIIKLKHENLVEYKNMMYYSKNQSTFVYVLSEFIFGISCETLLQIEVVVSIPILKLVAVGTLEGLNYLHKKNIVHRNVKASSVFITDKGVVKLLNYNIYNKLSDLVNPLPSAINYNKKTDIYSFGKIILSLLKGSTECDDSIPDSLSTDLFDFLGRCLAKEDRDRSSAYQLLQHQFFKTKPNIHFMLDDKVKNLIPQDANDKNSTDDTFSSLLSSQSRISSEFQLIEFIGQGAYGNVRKFRNKLDNRYYAIKRIKLNPKNKQLNKKIVREVQLLSRLNHENVVRYYNSWIETQEFSKPNSSSECEETFSELPKIQKIDEFTLSDNIEEMAPIGKVSITYDGKSQMGFDDSLDDDDDDLSDSSDDEVESNAWKNRYDESESDGIEFVTDSSSKVETGSSKKSNKSPEVIPEDNNFKIDFMYIQMEFCEKSTLRTAIDDNLYKDEPRVKRLFREIVEGLAYIHQQGIIHRDLKPVNIFLDLQDHVKIGDFGLATTNFRSKANEYSITKSALESLKEDGVDETKTGNIGTTLYVAPELNIGSRVIYNEKVDIYSLGVILFEMCYKSLPTTMERIQILTGIRKKEIQFPENLTESIVGKHSSLIRWLLDHDVSKRPTSQELLQSEHMPPPVVEETELMDIIRHTLHHPELKGYKYLIASCFEQKLTPAQDITYDRDFNNLTLNKPFEIYEQVRQIIVQVFQKHGGCNLATPLLMPNNKLYANSDACVKLMTHGGGVVTLPYDLRVPFARYIVWNHLIHFRRYSIERVYREKKVFGFLPRELYECAFDIVTPTPGTFMSDAEILYIMYEIVNEVPVMKTKNIIIHLNHVNLLHAILLHYGVKEDMQEEFISMLNDVKQSKIDKSKLQAYALELGLSESNATSLLTLLNSEIEIDNISSNFYSITKKKTEAGQIAKRALQELSTIIQNTRSMGLNLEMVLTPGLVYNLHQYSGVIFQFVCEFKKKHRQNKMEVIAAGGRYDSLIASYRNMVRGNIFDKEISQSAVGLSVSLDKIVQAVQKDESYMDNIDAYFEVIVASVGTKKFLKEKVKILSSLWSLGVRYVLVETLSFKDVEEVSEELKVPNLILFKDENPDIVIFRRIKKYKDKIFTVSELVEDLPRLLKPTDTHQQESGNNSKSDISLSRSESKSEKAHTSVSIIFATEKLLSHIRKRHENQISSNLNEVFEKLSGEIVVFAFNVDSALIKTLAAYLEFDSEENFQKSVKAVIEKQPRYKNIINNFCDDIFKQKNKFSKPLIILYSLTSYVYKII